MRRSLSSVTVSNLSMVSVAVSAALLGLLVSISAQAKEPTVLDEVMAKKHQDIRDLQKLIGPQFQLVGSYKVSKTQRTLKVGEELLSGVISSFDKGDVNRDGIEDRVLAVEDTQGRRSLRVYLGEKDGSFKLFREATKVVLPSDVRSHSDSFNSVQIHSQTGAITVSHLDDVSMRWERIQRFEFQKNEIVYVAQRSVSTDDRGTTVVDQNFTSGLQSIKTMVSGAPGLSLKSQLPKQAELTKLQDTIVTKD